MKKIKYFLFGRPTVTEFWESEEAVKSFKSFYAKEYLKICEEFVKKLEASVEELDKELEQKIIVSHYDWIQTGAEVFVSRMKKEVANHILSKTKSTFFANYGETVIRINQI